MSITAIVEVRPHGAPAKSVEALLGFIEAGVHCLVWSG